MRQLKPDAARDQGIVQPRPEWTGLDHDRQRVRGRMEWRQDHHEPRGVPTPHATFVYHRSGLVDDGDHDVLLMSIQPCKVCSVGCYLVFHDWPPTLGVRAPALHAALTGSTACAARPVAFIRSPRQTRQNKRKSSLRDQRISKFSARLSDQI